MGGNFPPGRWYWKRQEYRQTTRRTHTKRLRFCRTEDLTFVTKASQFRTNTTIGFYRQSAMSSSTAFAVASKVRTRWLKPGRANTESRKTERPDEQDLRA